MDAYSEPSTSSFQENNHEGISSSTESEHVAAWEHEELGEEEEFSGEAGQECVSGMDHKALLADEGSTEAEAPRHAMSTEALPTGAGIDEADAADASQAPGDAPLEGAVENPSLEAAAETAGEELSKEEEEEAAVAESAVALPPKEAVEQRPQEESSAAAASSETTTCSTHVDATEAVTVATVATTTQVEWTTVEGTASAVDGTSDAPEASTTSGSTVEEAWTEQLDSSGHPFDATTRQQFESTGQQYEAHASIVQSSYAYPAFTESNLATRGNESPAYGSAGWGSSSISGNGGGAWNTGGVPSSAEGAAVGAGGSWSSNSVYASSYGAYSSSNSAEAEWHAANAAAALAEERARAAAQAEEFARIAQELTETQKELAAARAARTEAEEATATSEAVRSTVEAQKRELEQDLEAEQCAADEAEAKLADFLKEAAAEEEARLADEAAADEALASGKGRGLDPVARAEASLRLAKKEAAGLREELKATAKAGLRQGQVNETLSLMCTGDLLLLLLISLHFALSALMFNLLIEDNF